MLPLILLLLGAALFTVGAVANGGNQAKARKRRLEDVRTRHGADATIETQMRRITAQQSSALDARLDQFLPNPELLKRRIEAAGKDWTLGRYAAGCGILAAVVMAVLLFERLPFLLSLFVGVLAGVGLPHFYIKRLARKRLQNFLLRFPDALELLVRGLRSGLPITETMAVVGSELPDPVGSEFRLVADRMRIGRTMEAALQDTADRLGTPEFQFFVITLAIQRETGGNLAETLGNLSDVLRKRLQMKLKVKAMSSESKASAWIIGSLPFAIFGAVYYLNPAYVGGFFTDSRLMIAAGFGAVWMSIGVFVMSKMINFEV